MGEVDFDTKVKKENRPSLVSITPLKDFEICCNEFHYKIEKGKKTKVNKMFLQNLITEGVINEK